MISLTLPYYERSRSRAHNSREDTTVAPCNSQLSEGASTPEREVWRFRGDTVDDGHRPSSHKHSRRARGKRILKVADFLGLTHK